jgi:hypothetical protein
MQALTDKERRRLKEISQRCYDFSTEISDFLEEIDAMMQINPRSEAVQVKHKLKNLLDSLDLIGAALAGIEEKVEAVFEAEEKLKTQEVAADVL